MSTFANAAAVRAFRLIELLARSETPLSLAEIVAHIDLPKQTVYRLLKQLEGAQLVTRSGPNRDYECSVRVRRMAVDLLMTAGPAAARRAALTNLAQTVEQTCNLAMSSGEEVIYLDRAEVNWSAPYDLDAGSRVPFHCTSSGKALLSFMPKPQREHLVRQLSLRRYTPNTITDTTQLLRELRAIRRRRYSVNDSEHRRGVIAIAAPVMINKRRACAAIAIQTSNVDTTTDDLLDYLPALQECAERMARTFL